MIGKLKGVIDEIGEDHCIVDVHGVGYVAWCSSRTLAALPSPGGSRVECGRCFRRVHTRII